jgi:hypothetical protein
LPSAPDGPQADGTRQTAAPPCHVPPHPTPAGTPHPTSTVTTTRRKDPNPLQPNRSGSRRTHPQPPKGQGAGTPHAH